MFVEILNIETLQIVAAAPLNEISNVSVTVHIKDKRDNSERLPIEGKICCTLNELQ